VGEFSEMLALEDKLSKPVRKLSLGERMKAELLAALLHYPKVLFLDEPTLGLDVNAQAAVREFLREYNQRHQATMILTSHYMADITALCERVILMHEGGLFYDGGLQELVEQFAPYREVMVEFAQALPEEKLAQYGELEEVEGREARFIIRREDLTQTTTKLLNQLDVVDLKVSDPPIEEIIGRLLHQGKLEKVESS
jgi:ABC-2 type transport system ATP-binding protein